MTAEEFQDNSGIFPSYSNGWESYYTSDEIRQLMVEFAKYHVEQALKEAVNNMKDGYVTDQDEEDVLNCYPPEKIK